MEPIDDSSLVKETYEVIMRNIRLFQYKGISKWGNPSGHSVTGEVYELTNDSNKIWVSGVQWGPRSISIITTKAIGTLGNNVSQIVEIGFFFHFSKHANTRLYCDSDRIEIRNYGKFTIGRRSLKKLDFFDYLTNNGYADEIKIDEEGEPYVCIFIVMRGKGNDLEKRYIAERLVKFTFMVKDFKDCYR